jgi:hypothetical protein
MKEQAEQHAPAGARQGDELWVSQEPFDGHWVDGEFVRHRLFLQPKSSQESLDRHGRGARDLGVTTLPVADGLAWLALLEAQRAAEFGGLEGPAKAPHLAKGGSGVADFIWRHG